MAFPERELAQKRQFDGLVQSVNELRSLLQESIVEAQNARARSVELRAATREIMASSAARREAREPESALAGRASSEG